MNQRMLLAMLFPVLAVAIIAAYAGGLGVLFINLESGPGEIAVIVVGLALLIGVPTVAYLLQRMIEGSGQSGPEDGQA